MKILSVLLSLFVCSLASAQTTDRPFVHPLFTDHMVLQREQEDPVWGWAKPGTEIQVEIADQTETATADDDGRWMAKVGPFDAGGPYELKVSSPGHTVTRTDVLVGDVWLCTGQSNMEMGIGIAGDAKAEIADADHPRLRLFTVPRIEQAQPQPLPADPPQNAGPLSRMGQWLTSTPENIQVGQWGGFSAAGYYFGRDLQQKLDVPIGLLHSSVGGTKIQRWISKAGLETYYPSEPEDLKKATNQWYQKNDPGTADQWQRPSLDTSDWESARVPMPWEQTEIGDFDGVVWYRTNVDVPQSWDGKDLVLSLGAIDDRDTTYFNGQAIGGLEQYSAKRQYRVPAKLVHAGRNTLAVRVLDTGGDGGFSSDAQQLQLRPAQSQSRDAKPLSLAGQWRYKIGVSLDDADGTPPTRTSGASTLYNGMIAPLEPFAIKGAIWYQGESNAFEPGVYDKLLPVLIDDWRSRFGVGEFPFLIVQLANFQAVQTQPIESGSWAELRQAQFNASQNVDGAGIVPIIDLGEAADIHPKNKQEVGRRAMLAALAVGYDRDVVHLGPTFDGMDTDGQKVTLSWDHLGDGLEVHGDTLKGFAIAGEDGKFVWAQAKIVDDTVVVWSPDVSDPTAVAYDWASNPIGNLYNKAGLPATPFRTDDPMGQ